MTFERAGPYINNVRKAIRKLPARKVKKEIILVIGTNDVTSKRPIDTITHDYDLLVKEAMLHADKVTPSNIPPGMDNKVTSDKMDTVNGIYHQIANKTKGITFVNHDKNVKYRDGSIDESMLLEGDWFHLSSKGTKKLIDNLSLDARPKTGSGPTNTLINNDSRLQHRDIRGKFLLQPQPGSHMTPPSSLHHGRYTNHHQYFHHSRTLSQSLLMWIILREAGDGQELAIYLTP